MKKKISCWCPFINKLVKVISKVNPYISFLKYNQEFEVSILNTYGEWDKFRLDFIRENIEYLIKEFGKVYIKNKTTLLVILSISEQKIKFGNKIQIKKKSSNFTILKYYKILNKILNQK
tara:strand:- start:45 stop:401 length:357 start_codon:yes stop_codon:yes gene_type:complete